MTKQEYDNIYHLVIEADTDNNPSSREFRWQLLKVLWEIRDVIKGGLEE